jgi:hypothetical protein
MHISFGAAFCTALCGVFASLPGASRCVGNNRSFLIGAPVTSRAVLLLLTCSDGNATTEYYLGTQDFAPIMVRPQLCAWHCNRLLSFGQCRYPIIAAQTVAAMMLTALLEG